MVVGCIYEMLEFLYTLYIVYRASIFCIWIFGNYIYLLFVSIYNKSKSKSMFGVSVLVYIESCCL